MCHEIRVDAVLAAAILMQSLRQNELSVNARSLFPFLSPLLSECVSSGGKVFEGNKIRKQRFSEKPLNCFLLV